MRTFVLLGTAAMLLGGPAWGQDGAAVPRYSLKQDDPHVAAKKRILVDGSVIPLDKTYAQLSPVEQGYLKSQYEGMGPMDEPPFPLNGLRSVYKAIATAQQRLLVTGKLSLFVQVDSEGKAVSVSVYQSPDPKMTQVVASILMLQEYKPARCDGSPCAMEFPFRFDFITE